MNRVLGFDSQWRLGIFFFTTMSRMAMRPTSFLSNGYWTEALSLLVKQPGYEADHSPPSSAKVKE
jgi:hypothetical protein